ncbi:hypothetical protein C7974DRAFT_396156 [Boeremia exigua]|uniref:uncharacterized protein n=1 Tax=Boeremia exigua TaxID=749465 RepID=UPI001E8E4BBD|nr:uncharacterized protein C7974DRAFT_396156 [Boeremia exigua]KAH6625482.1 hypothetical protein C7974DRAFT_396156 [Boeremia exigua]
MALAQYAVMMRGVTNSVTGRHLWDIDYALITLSPWTLLFLKNTFFLLYLHIFCHIQWVRISSWIGIWNVVVSMSAVGVYTFIIANPHENLSWTDNATHLGVLLGILSFVANIANFVIPFAAIIPLHYSVSSRRILREL